MNHENNTYRHSGVTLGRNPESGEEKSTFTFYIEGMARLAPMEFWHLLE